MAQVGPLVLLFEKSELGSTLGAPDDAGRGARGIQPGMGQVTFVSGAELPVDLATGLCALVSRSILIVKGARPLLAVSEATVGTGLSDAEAPSRLGNTGIAVHAELPIEERHGGGEDGWSNGNVVSCREARD